VPYKYIDYNTLKIVASTKYFFSKDICFGTKFDIFIALRHLMKNKLLLLFLVIPTYFLSQNSLNTNLKTVSGFVYHDNKPLENVTILVENTFRYAVSDAKGFYSIKTKPGETLVYSYVGLDKVNVLIEDITKILNLDLKLKSSITNVTPDKVVKLGETTFGENASNFLALKIEGKSLNKNAISLTRAIAEKVPDLLVRTNSFGEEIIYLRGKELNGPAIWDIDNVQFDIPYPIFIKEVKDVLIVNNKFKNPVIKVNTSIDYENVKNINYNNYYFTDADFYKNDAKKYKNVNTKYPFLEKFDKASKDDEKLTIYENSYALDKNLTNYHLAVFNYFKREKVAKNILLRVLSDFEKETENVEDLKAIAYNYQAINEYNKAILTYKKIINLKPNNKQSFRDLGNAYLATKQYDQFWFTYNYYLQKGFKITDNDISAIMSSEIMAVYDLDYETNRKKIQINDPTKNLISDVRMVLEWNVSEAEFIVELVNPKLEVFKFQNIASHNPELIIAQKKEGYFSKELIIKELNEGNHLINLTYLGNKQYKPTYFKLTTYYNWGKENQSKNIQVFELNQKNIKVQLTKLSRRYLR
jgi:tetratricopeptide (TPR) repeat protein